MGLLALLLQIPLASIVACKRNAMYISGAKLASVGLCLEMLACGLLVLLDLHTPTATWAVILVLGGIGHGVLTSALDATIKINANDVDALRAANMSSFLHSLGMCFGLATTSSIFLNLMKQRLEHLGLSDALAEHAIELIADLTLIPSSFPSKTLILRSYVHGCKGVAGVSTGLAGLALALSFFMKVKPVAKYTTVSLGAVAAKKNPPPRPPRSPLEPSATEELTMQSPKVSTHSLYHDTEDLGNRRMVRNTSWFLGPSGRPHFSPDEMPAPRQYPSSS